MSTTLSNALFYSVLGYAANEYLDENINSYLNDESITSSISVPISFATYSLLECAISLIGKNYLPQNVRTVMAFAGAVFATKEIVCRYGVQLTKWHDKNLDKPLLHVNNWEIKAKHAVITSVVALILFVK